VTSRQTGSYQVTIIEARLRLADRAGWSTDPGKDTLVNEETSQTSPPHPHTQILTAKKAAVESTGHRNAWSSIAAGVL
jgi:hypothetical protein